MNLIDLAILGVLALFVVIGYYRGFMTMLCTLLSSVLAILVGLVFYPAVASAFKTADKLIPSILNFSESADMIGSIDIYRSAVEQLDLNQISDLIETLNLPYPLDSVFFENIVNYRFADMGINWFGEYLSMTIAQMAVNVLSFMILFFGVFLLGMLASQLVDYVVDLPMLKHGDSICGAVLGFLLGAVVLYVVFMAVPVGLAFVPYDQLRIMMDSSQFSQLFYHSNFLLGWLKPFIK